MKQPAIKNDIFETLQKQIYSLQGFTAPTQGKRVNFGLGFIENSFPNQIFPTGAVHELISSSPVDAAATTGFMAALLGKLMQGGGLSLWISQKRTLYPPALKFFGIDPDRVIFIDVNNEKDLLWMSEEALKCQALSAVIAEIKDMDLTASRRLQLAVEKSRVTGLLHRMNPRTMGSTACAARWKVAPIASALEQDMPGMGFFRWDVQLLKVRNGEPGHWQIQWTSGSFDHVEKPVQTAPDKDLLKTG
ncbi:ImuA family protein [Dyadobacter sp. CY356]|uniref:ImuA family protein n=1 Tax=Dyadobacter sp. CY356 TaxID=2906442 RepID=UPI001F39C66F|nr:Error-prone repair protein ImuA [Dyadobacter sp. CY356]MCF0059097.1 Error-prone repair protein ImuA [Dyadobacter sp. CY356]